MTKKMIGHALAMAGRGYDVFPLGKLKPKEPIKGKSWLALMTREPGRIKATFKMKDASADTYAVVTGDGFVVVDVDVRDAKKGAETYDMLDMEYGFPKTFTVRTPTGGFHYFYKIPAGLKIGSDNKDRPVFGPGIDLKAWHGFVVGPGSKTELGTYEIVKDVPLADLPPWAFERMKLRGERPEKYTEPLQPWDLPENVERVTHYLKYEAEPAIENANGTLTAYKVACHVRDYAISKDTCRNLMIEHYDERCVPPFFDEMEYQAAKPYRYAKNRPGTHQAGTLEFCDSGVVVKLKFDFTGIATSFKDWLERELPEPDPLLGAALVTSLSRLLIIGPTGLGKTMFGLEVAAAIAMGKGFLHWKAGRKARVLYLDGEMPRGEMQERLKELADRHGGEITGGFDLLSREDAEDMPPLNREAGQRWLDAFIKHIGGVDLIIFDNVQCLLEGDPKEPEQWAKIKPYVLNLTKRRIAQIWFHHTGIEEGRGYGDKTREWMLTTVVVMERVTTPPGADVAFALKFPKKRGSKRGNRQDFEPVVLTLKDDVWGFTPLEAQKKGRPPKAATIALTALREALEERGATQTEVNPHIPSGVKVIDRKTWESYALARGLSGGETKDAKRKAFKRAETNLLTEQTVSTWDGQYWLPSDAEPWPGENITD